MTKHREALKPSAGRREGRPQQVWALAYNVRCKRLLYVRCSRGCECRTTLNSWFTVLSFLRHTCTILNIHTHTISHTHSQKAKDDDIETGHEKEAPGAAPWRWESDHPLRQLAANICESNPQDLQEHVFGHHHLLDPCWGAKHSVQRCTVGVDVERINVGLHTFFWVQDRASVKRTCKIELCLSLSSLSEVWSFMTVAIPELIDVGLAFEAKRIGASASVVWPTGLIMPYNP